jgi:Flp pilus assembly protein TadD
MGQNRPGFPCSPPIKIIIFLLSILIYSCTLPRIVVLDDPLSASEHNDLGVIYEQKGLYDLAEKEYAKAYKKQTEWATPYFNLGNLYFKKADYRKSEDYYRKAMKMDGNNPDVLNNLAYLLCILGKYPEAKMLAEKALSIERKKEYLDTYNKILERYRKD